MGVFVVPQSTHDHCCACTPQQVVTFQTARVVWEKKIVPQQEHDSVYHAYVVNIAALGCVNPAPAGQVYHRDDAVAPCQQSPRPSVPGRRPC